MSEFRFAVMGAGHIATKFCRTAKWIENCRVAAVASKSAERARDFAARMEIPAYYDDYEAMLIAQKPDCVYIATTPNDHYRLGMLCLKHRVPVLCEKAMFLNSREAETFFAEAKRVGVFSMEALWSRFLPAMLQARQWLADGEIGEAVMAEMGVGFIAPNDPQARYFNPALGGGAMYDLTVYGYELLTWALRREAERAEVQVTRGETGVDVSEMVLLHLTGGIPAVIKSSLVTPVEERMVIYGTKGKIIVPNAHFNSGAELYVQGELKARFTDERPQEGFIYEMKETIRCIREGRLESEVVPHSATIACSRLFDQILQAMADAP